MAFSSGAFKMICLDGLLNRNVFLYFILFYLNLGLMYMLKPDTCRIKKMIVTKI